MQTVWVQTLNMSEAGMALGPPYLIWFSYGMASSVGNSPKRDIWPDT